MILDPSGLTAIPFPGTGAAGGTLADICLANPVACGVAGAGLGGYGVGSLIYLMVAEPLGDAIDKICKPAIPDKEPGDFCEQLALAEAKAGAGTPIMGTMGDEPRLVAHYGPGPWIKMQHTHICYGGRKLVIHYFTNGRGLNVELKFV